MIKLSKAVIVEGKYDKIRLSNFIDAVIIETDGFRIFSDKEKKAFIKQLALTKGIIVMTDSDSAGFRIRNYIRNIAADGEVICLTFSARKNARQKLPKKANSVLKVFPKT